MRNSQATKPKPRSGAGVSALVCFPDPAPLPGADNPELTVDGNILALGLPNRTQDKLDNLFAEWDALDWQIKALTTERDEKRTALGELLERHNLKAVSCSDLSVRWVYSASSSINKMALLQNGVSADVIAASTKRTPKKYVKVTNPQRAAESENGEGE